MIIIDELKRNDMVWAVSQQVEEMVYPTEVSFHSRESEKGKKLVFVVKDQKRLCYPTHLLFTTKKQALIYASVNLLKLYYSFDPFFVAENVDEEVLIDAYAMFEKYQEEDPSMFLYYWMSDVPNR